MFADDVVVLSQTANVLKRAIDITVRFNLSVNFSKSQIMIFNSRWLLLDKNPNYQLYAGSKKLNIVNEYTYLGMKFTPSGAASHGASELFQKSKRSWFAISNLIFKH